MPAMSLMVGIYNQKTWLMCTDIFMVWQVTALSLSSWCIPTKIGGFIASFYIDLFLWPERQLWGKKKIPFHLFLCTRAYFALSCLQLWFILDMYQGSRIVILQISLFKHLKSGIFWRAFANYIKSFLFFKKIDWLRD